MKNRIPKYAGRIKLTQVSGNTYDMELADEPIQEGTPLTKENLLSDETAENLGLTSEDPTVDEALAALADANTVTFENYNDGSYIKFGIDRTDYGAISNTAYDSFPLAAQTGDYAVFWINASGTPYFDIFDENLARTTKSTYSSTYTYAGAMHGVNAGSYGLFATTYFSSDTAVVAPIVQTVDESLTVSKTSSALSSARYLCGAANNSSYAFFAGGVNGGFSTVYTTINAYNSSLTRSTPTALPTACYQAPSASTDNYAIFMMGHCVSGSATNFAVAYDTSATRTTLSTPAWSTVNGRSFEGVAVGDYVVFRTLSGDVLTVYDSSLTYLGTIDFPHNTLDCNSTGLSNYAVFANFEYSSEYPAYALDDSLTVSEIDPLDDPFRNWGTALHFKTDNAEMAMFYGGENSSGTLDYLGVYTLGEAGTIQTYDISVPPMSEYSFSDGSEGFATEETTVSGEGTVSGYIKRGNITV